MSDIPTAPAWQARESQQQEFINGLVCRIHDKADELVEDSNFPRYSSSYEVFVVDFLVGILSVARSPSTLPLRHCIPREFEVDFTIQSEKIKLSLYEIINEIQKFARVDSEVSYLLYKLFEKLQPALASLTTSRYEYQQTKNPETVFGEGVTSLTDEIPLE